jgi:hypothetical protein
MPATAQDEEEFIPITISSATTTTYSIAAIFLYYC